MDIVAHLLWTYIVFYGILRYSVMVGILPDVFSWGIYLAYALFTQVGFGRPDLAALPGWVFTLYGITHSLLIFSGVFIIVWLIVKKLPIYLLPWLLHIIIDIPSHSKSFLPTPFLWPLSDWKFPGISWGNPWFMGINYTLIIICLFLTLKYKKNVFGMLKEKLTNRN